jgi:hypothetical protein
MMNKNYVDDKEMESLRRKDENEFTDSNEKGRTGYNDGEDPSMKDKEQQFPGDEIVDDLRELSRQQGQRNGDPAFLNGENVQQENDRKRYGDSISKNADKEFQDPPSKSQNKSND